MLRLVALARRRHSRYEGCSPFDPSREGLFLGAFLGVVETLPLSLTPDPLTRTGA